MSRWFVPPVIVPAFLLILIAGYGFFRWDHHTLLPGRRRAGSYRDGQEYDDMFAWGM